MIVLDEQLLGYGLKPAIARWYRGKVTDITELRPRTRTRRSRLGKIARISQQQVQFYTTESWGIQTIDWSR